MKRSDVADVEDPSEPEFTQHADSAGNSNSVFFPRVFSVSRGHIGSYYI